MVLHLHPPGLDVPLAAVVVVAAVGATVLFGLALAAFLQRKSRPYLLIALAVAALLARALVAGLSMFEVVSPTQHHLFEHALDVAMAAFVIGAVYYARTVEQQLDRPGDR